MTEEEIKQIARDEAQSVHDSNATSDQFAVSQTPFHTHNNSDSQRVSYMNLSNKVLTFAYTLFGTQAATAGNYSVFLTTPYALTVSQVTEVHTALGTDGSAVTLNIEKLSGTTVPGSGTALLTTGFNLKGAINTVVTGSLSTSPGVVQLAAGDRLALKLTGTPTAVANVTVSFIFTLL